MPADVMKAADVTKAADMIVHGLLQDLSLAGNNLTELPEDIGQLTALERLQLSGNCFRTLPDSIGNLAELKASHLTFDY